MGEELGEVQLDEGTHVGVDSLAVLVYVTECEEDLLVCEVVGDDLQVSGVETGDDGAHGLLGSDLAVFKGQEFMQTLVERRAKPIHSIVNCVFNCWMPISLRKRVAVTNNVAHGMTVLEASELALSISNTQNKVAGSLCGLHAMDGLIEGLVPLENISEHEGKRIAESAFFSKGVVRV